MSVRIQQILQNETNLTAVTDPLGGSFYIETLTATLIEKAWAFFEEIQAKGGFLATLDSGWLHQQAAANQHAEWVAQAKGEERVIGVTDHFDDCSPFEVDGFMGVDDAFDVAIERLKEVKRTRHEAGAAEAMKNLERTARGSDNIMPAMMQALEAEVTLGEIGDIWRDVFGDWNTPIQL
jgi:methylmalonyl-CoA mutase N-terminal domain/subunit